MQNAINEKSVKNLVFGTFCFCGFLGSAVGIQTSFFDNPLTVSQSVEEPLTLQQKIRMDLLEVQDRISDAEKMMGYYLQFFGKWEETLGHLNDIGVNAHRYLASDVENLRMEDFILRFKIACFDLDKCQNLLEEDLNALSQSNEFGKTAAIYGSIIDHQEKIETALNDLEKLEMEYPESVIIQFEIYYEKIKDVETEALDYLRQAQKLLGLSAPETDKFSDVIKALEERSQSQNDPFHQLALDMFKLCQ
ncbi:MAG: hypothetical protein LBI77_02425 [Puniceicoccales bacterium]|jgi:hypothetical protein|nr:hypothetical protein [Puniceicoccales bacterium]